PLQMDYRIVDGGGAVRWMRLINRPHRQDGEVVWDGVSIEITEQKQAEEALRASEARALAAEARLKRQNADLEESRQHLLHAQRLGRMGHWITDLATSETTWSPG